MYCLALPNAACAMCACGSVITPFRHGCECDVQHGNSTSRSNIPPPLPHNTYAHARTHARTHIPPPFLVDTHACFGVHVLQAALYGRTDVVKALIDAGIDTEITNVHGQVQHTVCLTRKAKATGKQRGVCVSVQNADTDANQNSLSLLARLLHVHRRPQGCLRRYRGRRRSRCGRSSVALRSSTTTLSSRYSGAFVYDWGRG